MENKNPDEITADELAKITTSIAEADSFLRLSNYEKAEELYTNALPYFPSNSHILISRSQCRVLRGDYKGAEKDADALLTLDPKSTKAILCKANSLFANGDFEMAMVWYTRGKSIKREAEFVRGESRCIECIERAIEKFDPEKIKKHLKYLEKNRHYHNAHAHAMQGEDEKKSIDEMKLGIRTDLQNEQKQKINQNLLGENFEDYLYLRALEIDSLFACLDCDSGTVKSHISKSVDYLEKRLDFWRATNPRGAHESAVAAASRGKDKVPVKKYAVIPSIKA